ncbi:Octaprenyl diphosphate synthase [subsurface metagenome]
MTKQPSDKLMSYTPVALQMYDVLAEDMETVRELFGQELQSDLPAVNERIGQVGKFRGKMLRPCLVLLCGRACGPVGHSHHVVGAVVEMIHMAALIHDDVLDESQVRRRGATLNELYGNETAILAGDFLLSHTFSLCSQLRSQRLCSIIASTTNMVCEGEIMQVAHKGDWELREEEYLEIISRKTASLCGTCCRLGVECSGGSAELARAMDDYGCALGMAFQITDDLLDLVGSEPVMGKTLGRDFLQGKLTLPLIRAREQLKGGSRRELLELLRRARAEDLDRIRDIVSDCGGLDSVYQTAQEYIERAVEKLTVLPGGTEREALKKMAGFVVERHT